MNFDMDIAVLIPCYNEEITVAQVVRDFQRALPKAAIYVYDNNSSDQTSLVAHHAGAIVRKVDQRGKGNVVRRMFADIDADIYIMVDGDCTYDAKVAPHLIHTLMNEQLDMVVGVRIDEKQDPSNKSYKFGHQSGNRIFAKILKILFNSEFTDVCSGYRVFSRRFVKSFTCDSRLYEVEAELSIHAIELNLPFVEVETAYYSRPAGSSSKLRYFKDGFRIFYRVIRMLKYARPLFFFGWLCLASLLIGFLVSRTSGLWLMLSVGCLFCGILLDSVRYNRLERKRLFYLTESVTRKKRLLKLIDKMENLSQPL